MAILYYVYQHPQIWNPNDSSVIIYKLFVYRIPFLFKKNITTYLEFYHWINFGPIDFIFNERSVIAKSDRVRNDAESTTQESNHGQNDGSSLDIGA